MVYYRTIKMVSQRKLSHTGCVLFLLLNLTNVTFSNHLPWICQKICSCEELASSGLYSGNCSNRGLNQIPPDLSTNFVHLDFTYNNIKRIGSQDFANLTQLTILDLSNNQLNNLHFSAFSDLYSLCELKLNNNNLSLLLDQPPFTPLIFSHLTNLTTLIINSNSLVCNEGCGYPDHALSYLKNLQLLHIDGLPYKQFGPGFKNLTRLTNMTLGNTAKHIDTPVIYIDNNMFRNLEFTNLTYLHLTQCQIQTIEAEAFSPLKKLQTLIIERQHLSFEALKICLKGLSKSRVLTLILDHIHHHDKEFVLGADIFQPLINTSLTNLVLTDNGIVKVNDSFITYLPKSLQVFNMSYNGLVTGTQYWLFLIPELTNLTIFDGSNQGTGIGSSSSPFQKGFYLDRRNHSKSSPPLVQWPKNLEFIYMQNCNLNLHVSPLNFTTNKLLFANFSGNSMNLIGPLYNLHKLKYFDLSNTRGRHLNPYFFNDMPSLEELYLQNNELKCLSKDVEGITFSTNRALKYVDLSKNRIEHLPKLLFRSQMNMKKLIVSSNSLTQWTTSIRHMDQLVLLDISDNRLSSLSKSFQEELEILMQRSVFQLNIMDNPLQCTCDNIDIIKWIHRRQNHFINVEKYSCKMVPSINITFSNLPNLIDKLEKHCASKTILIASALSLTGLVVVLFLAAFIYRHIWQVRYYKNRLALRLRLYQPLLDDTDDQVNNMYDAFLSYDESQHQLIVENVYPILERQNGFKLCIHTRDFIPGNPVAYNIYQSVHNSKKTIAFITESYFQSKWCVYEMEMAYLESIHAGKQILVLVLMENIDVSKLPKDIQKILKYVTYLDYVRSTEEEFYNKLCSALKD